MLTQILTAVSITLAILGAILAVSDLVVRNHFSENSDDELDEEADDCDDAVCEKLEAILHLLEERIIALEHENSQLRLENKNLETELGKYKKDQRLYRRNDSPEI